MWEVKCVTVNIARTYITRHKFMMKRHIKGVHEKNRNHICEDCCIATGEKYNLKHHKCIHKNGDDVSMNTKDDLMKHKETVKKLGAKKLKCHVPRILKVSGIDSLRKSMKRCISTKLTQWRSLVAIVCMQ